MRVTYHGAGRPARTTLGRAQRARSGRDWPAGRGCPWHRGPIRRMSRSVPRETPMNLGFGELVLVLVIVLVLFGASRLPALGEGLGKAIRGFKDSMGGEPQEPGKPEQPKAEEPKA